MRRDDIPREAGEESALHRTVRAARAVVHVSAASLPYLTEIAVENARAAGRRLRRLF